MVELLAPVGGPASVEPAVQGGANAIYLGYGDFNARRNAKNFSAEELQSAIDYCHIRGVKVFLTLNTLLTQRELTPLQALLAEVGSMGIDAIIVQDLGVADLVKQANIPLHASTQTTVHSLDGILELEQLGFSRVVLARELGRSELEYLASRSPLELEVFVHGAQCMSYSGQCYLSAMVGERSGNRGLCAQPCRLAYSFSDGTKQASHPMSLKDMSLANHLKELSDMGMTSLKIEGRMKRPEYVSVVTSIYAKALKERRNPTKEEQIALETAFSREGFTQGYYQEQLGASMFGIRKETKDQPDPKELFAKARQTYENKELRKIKVTAHLEVGETALTLTLEDEDGHSVLGALDGVEPAKNKSLTAEVALGQLQRTGGTPYEIISGHMSISDGVALPLSKLNHLRRELLEELSTLRLGESKRDKQEILEKFATVAKAKSKPKTENPQNPLYTIWVQHPEQITEALLDKKPEVLYLPLNTSPQMVTRCQEKGITLCLQLPSIASDLERDNLNEKVKMFRSLGVKEGLCGTLDTLHWGKQLGLSLRGDYGLGIYNNHSLKQLEGQLSSAVPSFELKFPQIRDLNKNIPLEGMIYGHLPLMTTKNCMISCEHSGQKGKSKQSGKNHKTGKVQSHNCESCHKKCGDNLCLIDRKGEQFPVEQTFGGRNTLYNGRPLYLADKKEDWSHIGLWAVRLYFTRESPEKCLEIFNLYEQEATAPTQFTRGLYYRGVE